MSTTSSKGPSSNTTPLTSSVPIQTVFGDENASLGVVDWGSGAVGGKVHLGDTGNTSIWGSGGRIRGVSVLTLIQFLFKVMEAIKQESFQLFLELLSVFLHTDFHWQQIPYFWTNSSKTSTSKTPFVCWLLKFHCTWRPCVFQQLFKTIWSLSM